MARQTGGQADRYLAEALGLHPVALQLLHAVLVVSDVLLQLSALRPPPLALLLGVGQLGAGPSVLNHHHNNNHNNGFTYTRTRDGCEYSSLQISLI